MIVFGELARKIDRRHDVLRFQLILKPISVLIIVSFTNKVIVYVETVWVT